MALEKAHQLEMTQIERELKGKNCGKLTVALMREVL